MSDEEREDLAEEDSVGKKSPIRLIIILGIVVIALIGIVFAMLIFAPGVIPFLGDKPAAETATSGQAAQGEGGTEEDENVLGVLYSLQPFIVNLVDPNVQRYLKIKLELELNNKIVQSEIDLRMPQIKDSLLILLSSKSFSDIKSVEGKMRLRMEIIGRINSFLSDGRVKNVYFTEFVVQ
ncbi:MAG: flagellar basal body-associated FliL family protein [Deltaproteobacteria bacterium]|nr:flagellar basal body-associated FliL family protein [Deltaproteobacteria bacterium]MBW2050837.1 flagellar basal body-associated FliL family protein [Deltaproteobacteria bacterium]MBW2140061.1 flagellar basal body-associated FliL family protein [Deltaproteobacteria bacterium]MBW2322073.1 flagellar basal body-associated FliL family protein [Deltaproteobacteria bacterium]